MKILLTTVLLFLTFQIFSQNVMIPDQNFKNYLLNNTAVNTNSDSEIQVSEATAFTGTLAFQFHEINDLTGIEAFINLTVLDCGDNNLTSINLSQNIALLQLYCYDNQILNLDLSYNTILEALDCRNNQITNLDVSGNPDLYYLSCAFNEMESINVQNTVLTTLRCYANELTSLNLSSNTALTSLVCDYNNISELDLSNNTALTIIDCDYNNLISLNVANSNNTNFTYFAARFNPNLECVQVDDEVYSNTNWTNINGSTVFSENCLQITLDLKVFLEGPFNGTDLNTDLNDSNLIPLEQPYNVAPWNYNGAEQVVSIPDPEIVDWVLLELRETSGSAGGAIPASVIHQQAVFVNSNGNIVDLDGNSMISYDGIIAENLYVLIRHRNHLTVMSSGPLTEVGGVYAWDFTDLHSKAYSDGQNYIGGGKYGMTGGDCNSNGIINSADKVIKWNEKAGKAGYHLGDLNLDGQVNNMDKDDIWDINNGEEVQLPEGVVYHCGLELLDERNNTIYNTVEIGSQCWMAENLNLGVRIDATNYQSNNGTIEKYCYNDLQANCDLYGGLYRWEEMMNYTFSQGAQGICPDDWHIPADWEWTQLTNFLGGMSIAGGKLKETGTVHWESPNVGATNSSGFTGLPGGTWNPLTASYTVIGFQGYFWTSTGTSGGKAWDRAVQQWGTQVVKYDVARTWGLSIRCIKD